MRFLSIMALRMILMVATGLWLLAEVGFAEQLKSFTDQQGTVHINNIGPASEGTAGKMSPVSEPATQGKSHNLSAPPRLANQGTADKESPPPWPGAPGVRLRTDRPKRPNPVAGVIPPPPGSETPAPEESPGQVEEPPPPEPSQEN